MSSGVSDCDNTIMRVLGLVAWNSGIASRPLMPGRRRSSNTTSGRSDSAVSLSVRKAISVVPKAPVILMSEVSSIASAMTERYSVLSSTTMIRITVVSLWTFMNFLPDFQLPGFHIHGFQMALLKPMGPYFCSQCNACSAFWYVGCDNCATKKASTTKE